MPKGRSPRVCDESKLHGRSVDVGDGVMVKEVTAGRDPTARHRGHVRGVIIGMDTPIPGELDREMEAGVDLVKVLGMKQEELERLCEAAKPEDLQYVGRQLEVLAALNERGIKIPLRLLLVHTLA